MLARSPVAKLRSLPEASPSRCYARTPIRRTGPCRRQPPAPAPAGKWRRCACRCAYCGPVQVWPGWPVAYMLKTRHVAAAPLHADMAYMARLSRLQALAVPPAPDSSDLSDMVLTYRHQHRDLTFSSPPSKSRMFLVSYLLDTR